MQRDEAHEQIDSANRVYIQPRRIIHQGIRMLMATEFGTPWLANKARTEKWFLIVAI